jgi:hypothetical protein
VYILIIKVIKKLRTFQLFQLECLIYGDLRTISISES